MVYKIQNNTHAHVHAGCPILGIAALTVVMYKMYDNNYREYYRGGAGNKIDSYSANTSRMSMAKNF